MTDAALVKVQGLSKAFGNFTALKEIDLDIRQGEILTLLGPSGCGKSTLMRIIAGFDQPTTGTISLNGSDILRLPPERRPVNMVFQRYALFPHLDVYDNIAFGLRLKKMPEQEVRERVSRIIELVQLGPMADRWISEISGGQSQRVALARALVNEPRVLLLDEPLAALDLKIRQLMLAELKRIQESMGTTFVYVTHDQDEALALSNRIALMDHGRVVQLGTPDDIYFRPNSMFAARFLGETNVLEGVVQAVAKGVLTVRHASGMVEANEREGAFNVSDKVIIIIRPEAILAEPVKGINKATSNVFEAQLKSIVPVGGRLIATAMFKDGSTIRFQQPRVDPEQIFEIGNNVRVSWSSKVVSVFPRGA